VPATCGMKKQRTFHGNADTLFSRRLMSSCGTDIMNDNV